ncbi:MAG TPA: hypothetical protein VN715_15435 [Roseiarcus sp.]|nr:hypothetical protein [Roseiarcus sp.]
MKARIAKIDAFYRGPDMPANGMRAREMGFDLADNLHPPGSLDHRMWKRSVRELGPLDLFDPGVSGLREKASRKGHAFSRKPFCPESLKLTLAVQAGPHRYCSPSSNGGASNPERPVLEAVGASLTPRRTALSNRGFIRSSTFFNDSSGGLSVWLLDRWTCDTALPAFIAATMERGDGG